MNGAFLPALTACLGLLLAGLLPHQLPAQVLPQTLSAGSFHSIVLAPDGTLRAWGGNSSGQLGDGTATTCRASPVQPGSTSTWVQLANGGAHSLGLRADGTLWAWGLSYAGQLGDGTTTPRLSPVPVGIGTSC